jgi:hypothetical protein
MKVILKTKEWLRFIEQNDLCESLWDLIPEPITVINIEQIVWTGTKLYHLSYKGRTGLCWRNDIEEVILEEGDEVLFSYLE